jgi:3-oxoacyl-(acyl-carrier-protein) synthase
MIQRPKARIVITGMGVVAPNGNDKTSFWLSILGKQSAIGKITLFESDDCPVTIAGEVSNYDPSRYYKGQIRPKRMARQTSFAIGATSMAFDDADLCPEQIGPEKTVPIVLGVSTGAPEALENNMFRLFKHGPKRMSPYAISGCAPQNVGVVLSEQLGLETEAITLSTGCGAGLDAIATAADLIRSGRTDIAITGGTDAPITEFTMSSLAAAGMVVKYEGDPLQSSRPFDVNRTSGILSEGSGMLILENYDHALSRGIQPYAEITGYGNAMDRPNEIPGTGLERSMQKAMDNAGLRIQDVDYISAHGPGDRLLDVSEVDAIKQVFGERAYQFPVSSIKGVLGNPFAAAGPLQVISCAQAFRTNFIPPTANHTEPDPKCDLDFVSDLARKSELRTVLVNSHGMGGGNSTLVLERFTP